MKNIRSRYRLQESVEKARFQLSLINTEVPIYVECLAKDEDLNMTLSRDQLD